MLSICIPTLNRPHLFTECLRSIEELFLLTQDFELCISNNSSDLDYSEAEKLIEVFLLRGWSVSYVQQWDRLPLDEHMHYVIKMSTGKYCLLLGDDDLLIPQDIIALQSLLRAESPDLIACNSYIIDEQARVIGELPIKPGRFSSVSAGFIALRDKCNFGAVIVKRDLYDDRFELLYGSSHAYGSFWFALLDRIDEPCNIIVPRERITCIRKAEKNYDYLLVYFRDIPYEYSIYDRWLSNHEGRKLNYAYHQAIFARMKSIRFLCDLISKGYTYAQIVYVRPELKKDYFLALKFSMSFLFVKIGALKIYRRVRA
jgi:abequosyltransferase